ncbi:MAG: exodeoxyribonuclease VII large subunit [Lachnospira sp.]|nr:exodeoxyribonuclease VII large subunit [Lachnospira sp.]
MATSYTVTQMNSYIKNMFRQDFVLSRVSVKGEISNCKYHTSGHIYFTLKDDQGTLAAVMFATQVRGLKMRLENGMQVVVTGRIDVYERDGKYQLYANSIEADGVGDLYRKFEELKNYFEQMGYFSNDYKRPIPKYAKKIGIVTASTGAAIHDIMNISYRRNPYVELFLYPALVQGTGAAASIVKGIHTLDKMGMDVIIVGRGGGSIEDLWAFNEEIVVEAIFNANTPIISAVGHETDFTIADFVSDLRAPTPSAAAELSVADISLIEQRIDAYEVALNDCMEQKILRLRERVAAYNMQLKYLSPINRVNEKRMIVAGMQDKLEALMKQSVGNKRHQLEIFASRLHGLSPLEKLSQGYSYTEFEDGRTVKSVKDINKGDVLNIYLKDGSLKAKTVDVSVGG